MYVHRQSIQRVEGWEYVQIGRGFAQVHSSLESSLDLVLPRPASKLVRLILKLEKRQNYVLTHIYVYEWLVLWLWPLYFDDCLCSGAIDGSRRSRGVGVAVPIPGQARARAVDLRTGSGSRTRLLHLRYSLLVRVLDYSPHIRFAPHSFRPHTHSEIRHQFNVRPIK